MTITEDLSNFGILKEGSFDEQGSLVDWEVDSSVLDPVFPLWMLRELPIVSNDQGVYFRGIYSAAYTEKMKTAKIKSN